MKKMPLGFGVYIALATVLGVGLVILLLFGPRWLATVPAETPQAEAPATDVRKIRARLFYVNDEGTALIGVEQEVAYGEGIVEQAKRILEAQLESPPSPLASPIPSGTKLRTVFVTKDDVYVDLSGEVQRNHPGGTTNEILTVYALVSALTSNLPAIRTVQILVEGKEVDTLAGHLDLRRPIEQDARWVQE